MEVTFRPKGLDRDTGITFAINSIVTLVVVVMVIMLGSDGFAKNNRYTSCVEKLVPYVSENGVSMDEITNVCEHYLE